MFQEFNQYVDELLKAQFSVSEVVDHKPTKGTIREDFLIKHLQDQFPGASFHKGVIYDEATGTQSEQTDIIVTSHLARTRKLGTQSIVSLDDVKLVVEVKTCAKQEEFRKLNDQAQKFKRLAGRRGIKVGMFCYDYVMQKKTLLKKFGFQYSDEVEGFEKTGDVATYEHLDFVCSIGAKDEGKDFFLKKGMDGSFDYFIAPKPVSQYFFKLFRFEGAV